MIHWITPMMTVGHLILASGITVYIYIGLFFEEKDLVKRFGREYLDYHKSTPQLNPLLFPFKKAPNGMKWIKIIVVIAIVIAILYATQFILWVSKEMDMMHSNRSEIWKDQVHQLVKQNKSEIADSTAVLFVGSSLFRFWDDIKQDLHPVKVINNGFGGAKIADIFYFRKKLIDNFSPRQLVLFIGTNDICGHTNDKTPGEFVKDYISLLQDIHEQQPQCDIFILPITPTVARWYIWSLAKKANQLIKKYTEKHSYLKFVDAEQHILIAKGLPDWQLFKWDGTHLNRSGYQIWSDLLKKNLFQSTNLYYENIKKSIQY